MDYFCFQSALSRMLCLILFFHSSTRPRVDCRNQQFLKARSRQVESHPASQPLSSLLCFPGSGFSSVWAVGKGGEETEIPVCGSLTLWVLCLRLTLWACWCPCVVGAKSWWHILCLWRPLRSSWLDSSVIQKTGLGQTSSPPQLPPRLSPLQPVVTLRLYLSGVQGIVSMLVCNFTGI